MIVDLTLEIENGMPTCGTDWHQKVEICRMGTLESVGRNTHRIVLGSHSGTHIDAPFHFLSEGYTMEMIDVDYLWGDVRVVDFRSKKRGDVVQLEDIKSIPVEKRMLFAFGWYHNWKLDVYYRGFPYFSAEAVDYLIDNGMKMMAMDTPSPDDGSSISQSGISDSPNHKKLLSKGVVIVEYLCNTDVLEPEKRYEIAAFPLKVKGSDGSPARVMLREVCAK